MNDSSPNSSPIWGGWSREAAGPHGAPTARPWALAALTDLNLASQACGGLGTAQILIVQAATERASIFRAPRAALPVHEARHGPL